MSPHRTSLCIRFSWHTMIPLHTQSHNHVCSTKSIRRTSCSSGPEPASHSDVCYPAIVPCQLTVTPHTIVAGHQHRKLLALIGANRAVRAPQHSVNARCPRAYICKRACRSCRGSQRIRQVYPATIVPANTLRMVVVGRSSAAHSKTRIPRTASTQS